MTPPAHFRPLFMVSTVPDLHLLIQTGELDRVEAQCRKLIAKNPSYAEGWHLRGVVAYQQARFSDALGYLQRAVALDEPNPFYHNNLGLTLQALERYAEAAAELRRAIELQPATAAFLGNLANVLNHLEQYAGAESLARAALKIDPHHVDAYIGLGAALNYQGLSDQAESCFGRAAELAPDNVEVRRNLGHIYQETGRFDAAQQEYEFCLQKDPTDGDAWFGVASTRRFTSADSVTIARLIAAQRSPSLPANVRSDLHYALGKIHNDCGQYELAFAEFSAAKQTPHAPYDRDGFRARVDAWIKAFPRSRFTHPSAGASESELPVFIVGMPRSGSTLVEQILGAHREVYPGGELTDLRAIMTGQHPAPGTLTADPQTLTELQADKIAQWSQWYLSRRRIVAGDALRVTDKMPINFMFLGLIALMFPRARVIHCRRHPLDCGLSIYGQRFVHPPEYSYDLADIGHYYREYERLMSHWCSVLPLPVLEVQYEELVEQPETQVRKLVEFLGLEWDTRCLRFHEQRHPVQTASSWQVRQPMHRAAVGRWRNYQVQLEPLVRAIGQGAVTLLATEGMGNWQTNSQMIND